MEPWERAGSSINESDNPKWPATGTSDDRLVTLEDLR